MHPVGTFASLLAGFVLGNDTLRTNLFKAVQDRIKELAVQTEEKEVKNASDDV